MLATVRRSELPAGFLKLSIPDETTSMISSYPGMITASLGTGLIVALVVSSIVIVRRRMRYEWWYAVHLTAYAGIRRAGVDRAARARLRGDDDPRRRARPLHAGPSVGPVAGSSPRTLRTMSTAITR